MRATPCKNLMIVGACVARLPRDLAGDPSIASVVHRRPGMPLSPRPIAGRGLGEGRFQPRAIVCEASYTAGVLGTVAFGRTLIRRTQGARRPLPQGEAQAADGSPDRRVEGFEDACARTPDDAGGAD